MPSTNQSLPEVPEKKEAADVSCLRRSVRKKVVGKGSDDALSESLVSQLSKEWLIKKLSMKCVLTKCEVYIKMGTE
uniref:Uncharacterized protein n=1 Tax=Globodera rostochiensis TaxID=31243 RepID=A0A914GTU7_GLORO